MKKICSYLFSFSVIFGSINNVNALTPSTATALSIASAVGLAGALACRQQPVHPIAAGALAGGFGLLMHYVFNDFTPQARVDRAMNTIAYINNQIYMQDGQLPTYQEFEIIIQKRFVKETWPLVAAFHWINGLHSKATSSVDELQRAQNDITNIDEFKYRPAHLITCLQELMEELDSFLLCIKQQPGFNAQMDRYNQYLARIEAQQRYEQERADRERHMRELREREARIIAQQRPTVTIYNY